jgi:hypothetical protein
VACGVQLTSRSTGPVLPLPLAIVKNALRRALHKAEIKVWHDRHLIGRSIFFLELVSITGGLAHASNILCSLASCRRNIAADGGLDGKDAWMPVLMVSIGFMIDEHHAIDYCYLVSSIADMRYQTSTAVAGVPKRMQTARTNQRPTLEHNVNLHTARKHV